MPKKKKQLFKLPGSLFTNDSKRRGASDFFRKISNFLKTCQIKLSRLWIRVLGDDSTKRTKEQEEGANKRTINVE